MIPELKISFPSNGNTLSDLIKVIVFNKDVSILNEYDDFEFLKILTILQQHSKHITNIGYANCEDKDTFRVCMCVKVFRDLSGKELDFIQYLTEKNR